MLVHNGALFVIGGDGAFGLEKDVWKSIDGLQWVQATSDGEFTARYASALTEFKDALWLSGGRTNSQENTSDVWTSKDAISWTRTTADAGFPKRNGHQMIAFNDKLWVIGGFFENFGNNDIWSSADGASWTREIEHAAFPPRAKFALLNFHNELWLMGGQDYVTNRKDVWKSSDGVTWTLVADDLAVLDNRQLFGATVFNDKLWITSGFNGSSLNDVWSSSDGIAWTPVTAAAAFPVRNGLQMVSHAGKLWVITPKGEVSTVATKGEALKAITGLAIAPDDTLYIVDQTDADPRTDGGNVKRMTADGTVTVFATITDAKGFIRPDDMSLDVAGNDYVSARARAEVWRFNKDGSGGLAWWIPPKLDGVDALKVVRAGQGQERQGGGAGFGHGDPSCAKAARA
jgi:hypothetical protein